MMPKNIDIMQYECTFTPLTPIQIGNGSEISPFEYVIKNGNYFKIDANEVIEKFPENIKKEFIKTLEEKSMISARKFLKNNYREEYGYLYKCIVSDEIIKLYNEKIGGAIKKNEDNNLTIFEFIGTHRGKYIPGSTLKGAFRSAYLMENFTEEDFYKIYREAENKYGKKIPTKPFKSVLNKKIEEDKIISRILELENFDAKLDPFKNLKITDTEIRNDIIEIKEILRKGIKKGEMSLMPMGNFEVTKSLFSSNENVELSFNISIKNLTGNMEELFKKLSTKKDKKTERFIPIVKGTTDFYLEDNGFLDFLNNKAEKIIEEDIKFFEKIEDKKSLNICYELLKYRKKLKENQALIRIGRGAGFNSTTFNLCNKKIEEVFTRVTVEDMPIGWGLITCNEI